MTEDDLPVQARNLVATLRLASDIGGEIAKVVAYVSVPITTYLLVRYLSAVSVPFPIGLSSSPTLIAVLATTFCMVFVSFACTMAWVILQAVPFRWARLRRETPHLRSHVIPFKWPKSGNVASRRRSIGWNRARGRFLGLALLDYLLVFFPFVALWVCMAAGTVVGWQPSPITLLIATIGCLLVGAGASACLFYWLKVRGSSAAHSEAPGRRSLRFALLGLAESLVTLATIMFFLALTDAVTQAEHAKSFGMLVLGTILAAHLSANISRSEPATTVAVWMVVLFMVVSVPFGAPMYGALSLRMLGIGGGVGKEIPLRTFDVSVHPGTNRVF
jgi:hypothetical protein